VKTEDPVENPIAWAFKGIISASKRNNRNKERNLGILVFLII